MVQKLVRCGGQEVSVQEEGNGITGEHHNKQKKGRGHPQKLAIDWKLKYPWWWRATTTLTCTTLTWR